MLSILSKNNTRNMSSPILHKFKTQASFYLKEKIKTARLALTDVTPAQLLTEEATKGNPWPPDTQTMKIISRAAFEVDDYWRIVEIIHQRIVKFDRKNWRASYNALFLLEYLLTHGPKRTVEEFQSDKDVIEEMAYFQYIDDKGFNWGSSVRKLSEKILQLLEDERILSEERERARKLTREIKGFGSFNLQRSSSPIDESFKDLSIKTYGRCNSQFNDHQNQQNRFLGMNESFLTTKDRYEEVQETNKNSVQETHPFCKNELETRTSLLSVSD